MKIKKSLMFIAQVCMIIPVIWLFQVGSKYGIIGLVVAIVIILGLRVWTSPGSWGTYLQSLRLLETKMFGKPLDKEYWNKGEKARMPKIVWRKKK